MHLPPSQAGAQWKPHLPSYNFPRYPQIVCVCCRKRKSVSSRPTQISKGNSHHNIPWSSYALFFHYCTSRNTMTPGCDRTSPTSPQSRGIRPSFPNSGQTTLHTLIFSLIRPLVISSETFVSPMPDPGDFATEMKEGREMRSWNSCEWRGSTRGLITLTLWSSGRAGCRLVQDRRTYPANDNLKLEPGVPRKFMAVC
jgi:hypothetical protein